MEETRERGLVNSKTNSDPCPCEAPVFAFCILEGATHDHMTLHPQYNPLPNHRRPKDAFKRSRDCDKMF